MVFSSQFFLYGFIPAFFCLYYIIGLRWRNWLILSASVLFYSVGAGSTVVVLLLSVLVNQYLVERIETARAPRRRLLLGTGVAINLLGLAVYKYTGFLWELTAQIVEFVGLGILPATPAIPLPIGISFFTFQAVSYLIDVYRSDVSAAAS
jgi:alginate O-acetyltransferase complex protein AlgI